MAKLTKKGLITLEEVWWIKAVTLCYIMGWRLEDVKKMSVEDIEKTLAVLSGLEHTEPKKVRKELR